MAKNKYTVHFGVRLTYDVTVEAENMQEAIAKARPEWENAEYKDMDYASQDVDAWLDKD